MDEARKGEMAILLLKCRLATEHGGTFSADLKGLFKELKARGISPEEAKEFAEWLMHEVMTEYDDGRFKNAREHVCRHCGMAYTSGKPDEAVHRRICGE